MAVLVTIARTVALALAILLTLALVAFGAIQLYARGGMSALLARDLPASGSPELGVDYRADVDCQHVIRVGDVAWRVNATSGWPPPEEWPGLRERFSTWTVPGIVRFVTPTAAVFRAQTNGSEWQVTPASDVLDGPCI